MESIGQRIRLARKVQGWTIRKLSDSTGYTELTIGKIERGEYVPSDRLIRAIEKALKTKLRR